MLVRTSFVLLSLAISLNAQADVETKKGDDPELWLLQKVIQSAAKKVRASVVTVETFGGVRKSLAQRPRPGIPQPKPKKDGKKKKKGLGPLKMPGFLTAQGPSTGLVIGKDGWILTSRFALSWDPTTVLVTLDDGRKFTAKRHGEDQTRGLALLKIEADDLTVPTITDEVDVGQWAFAIARSFGQKHPTVHAGMISAVRRIQGRAIQTDASTSPANYGGPLVDLEGRVVGLVVPLSPRGDMAGADWYDSGIGFAATLADIGDKLDGMKAGKVYKKALLGVTMDPSWLGPGARVASIRKNSAAHQALVRKGDTILAIDGAKVRHSMHLQDLIGYHVAGDWLEVVVKRKNGGESKVLVQLDGA